MYICSKYNIDESHSLGHSLDVLNNANNIVTYEMKNYPYIEKQEKIIYVSALLHDMCDRKYVDEKTGIDEIKEFLSYEMKEEEIDIIVKIISTMSYSKVKKNGYPNLGEYQLAYHIVRESDLLAAYNFDRCVMYSMYKYNYDVDKSYQNSYDLFECRVLKHNEDDLFITEYSKKTSKILHENAIERINTWKRILKNQVLR